MMRIDFRKIEVIDIEGNKSTMMYRRSLLMQFIKTQVILVS